MFTIEDRIQSQFWKQNIRNFFLNFHELHHKEVNFSLQIAFLFKNGLGLKYFQFLRLKFCFTCLQSMEYLIFSSFFIAYNTDDNIRQFFFYHKLKIHKHNPTKYSKLEVFVTFILIFCYMEIFQRFYQACFQGILIHLFQKSTRCTIIKVFDLTLQTI